jgi:hypothetical protein
VASDVPAACVALFSAIHLLCCAVAI